MNKNDDWREEFDTIEDFLELLDIPGSSSGMFGRTSSGTIRNLMSDNDALTERVKVLEAALQDMLDCVDEDLVQDAELEHLEKTFVFAINLLKADK